MRTIKVVAENKEEALETGMERLASQVKGEIKREDLEVRLIEEKKGFLGIGSRKTYQVSLIKNILSDREEGFLETTLESIKVDGDFSLKVIDDGIYIQITTPEGDGRSVQYQEIKDALDSREIVEIDWTVIQDELQEPSGDWILIAPRKPELDRDAEVEVEISKDKLQAFVSYKPALGGRGLSFDRLKQKLQKAGVVYGIDESRLKKMLEVGEEVDHLEIASGMPPVPGEDARLIYHFEQETESVGTEREDGTIDFRDLGLIRNVEPGDVLVTRVEAIPGESGKAVTGEELPAPRPRKIELPAGKNVEKRDENTLVAAQAGQIVQERKRVHVLPVYEVDGDVDMNTGNIKFIGNVLVKGNVQEDFKIEADGNVEVMGNVNAADIKARGDVLIHKGYIGKNKHAITAGGDVRVKFIENGIIDAENNIKVQDAVMHSRLTAGKTIQVVEQKGLLVGGAYRARDWIEANIIGSALATTTYLEVGVDPELRSRLKELEAGLKEDRLNLDKSKKALALLYKLRQDADGLPQDKELMLKRLEKTVVRLKSLVADKKEEIEIVRDRMNMVEDGYIAARKRFYPGVRMTVGRSQLNIHDEKGPLKFVESRGEVIERVV